MRIIRTVIFLLLAGLFVFAQTKPKSTKQAAPSKASMERGENIYDSYCLPCHQADGNGVPMMNPPLVKTKWVLGDKQTLIGILLKGMNEEIEINGENYTNTMPSQAHLNDQQIADVLTYVRNSFGNKGTAVSASEVKALRAKLN